MDDTTIQQFLKVYGDGWIPHTVGDPIPCKRSLEIDVVYVNYHTNPPSCAIAWSVHAEDLIRHAFSSYKSVWECRNHWIRDAAVQGSSNAWTCPGPGTKWDHIRITHWRPADLYIPVDDDEDDSDTYYEDDEEEYYEDEEEDN